MKLKTAIASVALAGSIAAVSTPAMARDTVNIVGSSTVYPFATVVAERFGRNTDFLTPKLESTGSGGGLKLFCAGIGTQHPDITNASRRMKTSEFQDCQNNGVKDITEVRIGSDAIVIAAGNAPPELNLSLQQLFLALAKDVPNPNGGENLVPNPYKKWSDISSDLPNIAISVMGPPPTSGTRDAFVEIAMEGGCKKYDWIKSKSKGDMRAICHNMREDGAFIEAGENDNLIVQRLLRDNGIYGVFGFSFYEENRNQLQVANVDGVAPSQDTIGDDSYPVARSMFFYVKKAHVGVVPGIQEYVSEFTSEGAWGDNGYLVDVGLIPNPRNVRMQTAKDAKALKTMTGNEL